MELKELGSYIWSDKKRRSIAIMSVLMIALGIFEIRRLANVKPPPPPGAKRVVICKKCRFVDARRIVDIKNTKQKCVKCGGSLGIAWKCGTCKYEYFVVDSKPDLAKLTNTMRKFEFVARSRRCPNCKEDKSVAPMSMSEYDEEYTK